MSIFKDFKEYSNIQGRMKHLENVLQNHQVLKGRRGQTALSMDEGMLIVEALKFTAKCGYPIGYKDVLNMVESYLKSHPEQHSLVIID